MSSTFDVVQDRVDPETGEVVGLHVVTTHDTYDEAEAMADYLNRTERVDIYCAIVG